MWSYDDDDGRKVDGSKCGSRAEKEKIEMAPPFFIFIFPMFYSDIVIIIFLIPQGTVHYPGENNL